MKKYQTKDRILVITNKYYEDDPRPQREVAALIENGYFVDLICPSRTTRLNDKNNMRFYPIKFIRKRGSKFQYIYEYIIYFLFVSFMSTKLYLKHHHKLFYIFVMPEALLVACIIPKLMGAKIIMDWEDPMQELFLSIYEQDASSLLLFFIRLFEKGSVKIADYIVTPNEGFRKAFIKRGIPREKISIVMNSADEKIFNKKVVRKNKVIQKKDFTILYSGTILPRGGLDVAIKAFKLVVDKIKNARFVVVGDGKRDFFSYCRNLAISLDINDRIEFKGRVSLEEIPIIIEESTIAVISNRKNKFTEINFPTRISEYAIMKIPMVVPRLSGIIDYMDENCVCFFQPSNHKDLARCIIELSSSKRKRQEIIENAYQRSKAFSWAKIKQVYLNLIKRFDQEY